MSSSVYENEFVSHVLNLMRPIGQAIAKRMFGGHGIFLDGLMFALVADGSLYFKGNAETAKDFNVRNLERFSYQKKNKKCYLSYYEAPEECLEDSDEMTRWGEQAFFVARQVKR